MSFIPRLFEALGGRKSALGFFVVVVGVVIEMVTKSGLTENLLELLKFVSLGFFGSNAAITVAASMKGGSGGGGEVAEASAPEIAPQPAPAVDLEPVKYELNHIKGQLQETLQGQTLGNQGISFLVSYVQSTLQQPTERR